MKKLLLISFVAAMLCACGRHMYSTRSSGEDNVSYVIVLTERAYFPDVVVEVDGKRSPIAKVYKEKKARKAHPVIITPGKHVVKVFSQAKQLTEENIFIGVQETKKIVLR